MPVVLVLPELFEFLATAIAFLIGAWAAWRSGELIADGLRQLPIIGQALAQAVVDAVVKLRAQSQIWADQAAQPVTDFVDLVTGTIQGWVRSAANAIALVNYVSTTLGAGLNAISGAFFTTSAQLWARITATAGAVAANVTRTLSLEAQLAYTIASRLPAAIYAATTAAERASAAALAAASSALRLAIAQATATAHALVSTEAAARQAADAALRAAAAAEAAAVARAAATATATLERGVGLELGQLGQAIDGVAAKVGPWVSPVTIAASVGALTAELARVAECADPLCNTFGNDLDYLNAILAPATLAAIAGLVAEAAQHPEAAAATTVQASSSIVGGAVGLFESIAGVHV